MERDQILSKLRERIVRFAASRLVGTPGASAGPLAEDVAQEVLLVLHEKYPDLDRAEDLIPLSLEIARRKILGARRKVIRRGEHNQLPVDEMPLASTDAGPFEQVRRAEQVERLELALGRLTGRCRELMRMKLEGLGFAEIGERLGAGSINTVYTWDFRCRKQLLEKLGGSWLEPEPAAGVGDGESEVVESEPVRGRELKGIAE